MFHADITVCVRSSLSVCVSVCPSFVLKIGGEVGGDKMLSYGQGHNEGLCKSYSAFLTNKSFATELTVMTDRHKPKCPLKILDYVQGQGHSKVSNCAVMFALMISSEPLFLLYSNLEVVWCIRISRAVVRECWVAVFTLKVTSLA